MTNGNQDVKIVSQILSSDIVKTLVSIVFFSVIMTWNLNTAKNDLEKSISDLSHKIELQNAQIENRIQNIEDRQERDFKYITENFVQKKDYKK